MKTKNSQNLTYRKKEYLALMVMGFSNQEIAECLNVSPGTVKDTMAYLFAHLDAVNRTHAAYIASNKNILPETFCQYILNKYPLST